MPREVFTITDAQRALSEEQTGRTRRYLISMSIRTVCFLLAIFVPGWPKIVFAVAAFVLPYLAVVAANAGRESDEPGTVGVTSEPRTAIPTARCRIQDEEQAHR